MSYVIVIEESQVTEEILQIAFDVVDGWYQDVRVDWEDAIDRMDGAELPDGSILDLGNSMMSPAIRKIKREVAKYRR